MTREEAIAILKAFMENPLFSDAHKQAFNIAIHDIKQRHDWDINNLILINKENYEPAEQEPIRPKGKWISHHCGAYYECSNCHERNNSRYDKYCKFCGADMRGEEE